MENQNISLNTRVALAVGDGIGPEISAATLQILEAAHAPIEWVPIEVGKVVYERGESSGISSHAWEAIESTGIMLKGPIFTPSGGGFKSLNVTLRKTLGLYANVRPCVAYAPFVRTRHPKMDVVIVRENEEDLYAGIEHRQTDQVMQCLKLISRPGCEKIVRYAFEYASRSGRKRVTCFTKDNIMKQTDGLFHQVFNEISSQYPLIESDHMIVDIGAAKLADTPEKFDVIVMPNLYGDILSDVAAQIAGSIGLAGTANIGPHAAMFEAIHGSAPDIAGQNVANPSGMLLSAVMMLVHLGQTEVASLVHNAWLKTLEEGLHTADIWGEKSTQKLGTREFGEAVAARLGQKPETFSPVAYAKPSTGTAAIAAANVPHPRAKKEMVGVDFFLQFHGSARELGEKLSPISSARLKLQMITNRGVKVWPNGHAGTFCTDHWRCRFQSPEGHLEHWQILALYSRLVDDGFDVIKSENLCTFDGEPGFSMGQGQ